MDPLRKQEIYAPLAAHSFANSSFRTLPMEVIKDIFAYLTEHWKTLNRVCRPFFFVQNDVRIPAYLTVYVANRIIGLSELSIYKRVHDLFHATPYIRIDHRTRKIHTISPEMIFGQKNDRFNSSSPHYILDQHIDRIRRFILSIQKRGYPANSLLVLDVRKYLGETQICNERLLSFIPKILVMAAFQMPPRSFIMNVHVSDLSPLAVWKDDQNQLCTGPYLPLRYSNSVQYRCG